MVDLLNMGIFFQSINIEYMEFKMGIIEMINTWN